MHYSSPKLMKNSFRRIANNDGSRPNSFFTDCDFPMSGLWFFLILFPSKFSMTLDKLSVVQMSQNNNKIVKIAQSNTGTGRVEHS